MLDSWQQVSKKTKSSRDLIFTGDLVATYILNISHSYDIHYFECKKNSVLQ